MSILRNPRTSSAKATADDVAGADTPMTAIGLWDGQKIDRARTDGGGRISTDAVDYLGPIANTLWALLVVASEGMKVPLEDFGSSPFAPTKT